MKECSLGKLRYLIRYPKNHTDGQVHPVLFYLHGAGARAQDFEKLKSNIFFQTTQNYAQFPFLTIAPLCTENTWFDLWEHLHLLVREVANMPCADPTRMYLIGNSMGGYATWQLAMSMPEYIAAIIPICGGGMYWNASRLADVPVWAFHGAKDQVVLPEESEKMVKQVNEKGGNARLTVYPENMHDSWSDTYANPEVFTWLLSHQKRMAHTHTEEFTDVVKYG